MPDLPSRLGRWATQLLAVGPARGRRSAVELAGLLVLVVVIGLVDRAAGYQLRFGVFYLVPVWIATVRCGPRAAMVAVLLSTFVGAGPAGPSDAGWGLDLLNLGFRFSMLAFSVGLLSLLVRAIDEARASDRRSREFLQYAAHQLRTPTTSVSMTAQGLLANGHGQGDEEALLRIVSEANRVGRLVTAMLRFVRLERGDALTEVVGDLRTIAEEEVHRWRDVAAPTEISLDLPAGGAPIAVPQEASREVFEILLDNATRHAEATVAVAVRAQDGNVEIRVGDDGPGPPAGREEDIFGPFVSLDGLGGSGLGLAIGRRVVAAVGGSLTYDGTAFVATIPAARRRASEVSRWPGRADPARAGS